jgi:hypothetical protein
MRTVSGVKAVFRRSIGPPYQVGAERLGTVVPTASVHQPSIRARTAAHDVSIRSSTIAATDRRGWASHSVSRSWQTIDNPENARTGTSACGNELWCRRSLTSPRRSSDCAQQRAAHGRAAETPGSRCDRGASRTSGREVFGRARPSPWAVRGDAGPQNTDDGDRRPPAPRAARPVPTPSEGARCPAW